MLIKYKNRKYGEKCKNTVFVFCEVLLWCDEQMKWPGQQHNLLTDVYKRTYTYEIWW